MVQVLQARKFIKKQTPEECTLCENIARIKYKLQRSDILKKLFIVSLKPYLINSK